MRCTCVLVINYHYHSYPLQVTTKFWKPINVFSVTACGGDECANLRPSPTRKKLQSVPAFSKEYFHSAVWQRLLATFNPWSIPQVTIQNWAADVREPQRPKITAATPIQIPPHPAKLFDASSSDVSAPTFESKALLDPFKTLIQHFRTFLRST